jgi:hypothetical protein
VAFESSKIVYEFLDSPIRSPALYHGLTLRSMTNSTEIRSDHENENTLI